MQIRRSSFDRIALAMLFCLGCVVEANAQTARTRGWMVGLEFGRATVSFEGDPADGAALVGARIGHAVNRVVTPYLGLAYADIESRGLAGFDNLTFAHVDLGMRLHLADDRRRWIPYGDLALTWWPVRDVVENGKRTGTDFTSRPTLSVGGGLAVYLSERWALDVNVKAGKGTFEDVAFELRAHGASGHPDARLDLDAVSVRLGVGFSWWP